MPPDALFPDDPEETRVAIMKATYDALRTHGYADLTIDRIGQEFPKSKSLLYHHYDSKDDLLLDFLTYLLDELERDVEPPAGEDARAQLTALLDSVLDPDPEPEHTDFMDALVELRAQAAHDDDYRDHFTRSDAVLRERLEAIVRHGIEDGTFRDVDPEDAARFLQTTMDGVLFERATTESVDVDAIRAGIDAYVRAELLAE